ncbi:MAG: hypothetical protein HQ483_07525 [Rhodospirillales bacterium]|nr:hypothetical protein [Rhodospirillales bacterium]
MRLLMMLGVAVWLAGCAVTHVGIDERTGLVNKEAALAQSPEAAELVYSTNYCKARLCSQTPVLMLVIGRRAVAEKATNASLASTARLQGFMFAGTTVYDGRIRPHGVKYLGYRDPEGKLVCQGYYSWSGFGRASDVKLRCFDDSAEVTGKIRNAGRQPKGPYRGKGIGTGVLTFDGGLVAVVYGVNPADLKTRDFIQLWVQHGGDRNELPVRKMPPRVDKVPLLNGGKTT